MSTVTTLTRLPGPDDSLKPVLFLFADDSADLTCFVQRIADDRYTLLVVTTMEALSNSVRSNPGALLLVSAAKFLSHTEELRIMLDVDDSLLAVLVRDRGESSPEIESLLRFGFSDVLFYDDDASLLRARLVGYCAKQQLRAEIIRLTEERITAERQLDEYVYVVSHDLKAPIRGLSSLADFIAEELGDTASPAVKELLAMMQSRTGRMQQMIDGILHYSRTAGRSHPSEEVSVNVLINNEIEGFSTENTVHIHCPDAMPVLMTDKTKLKEVLFNLIQNGVRHNDRPEKHIRISCQDLGDMVEFSVSDNGKGIKPDHREKVFGLFQTLHSKDDSDGIGLGLAIVKKIVEQQQGKVRVESQLGSGSTFSFTWRKS